MFKNFARFSLISLFLLLMGASQMASATLVNICLNPRTPSAAAGMSFGPIIQVTFTGSATAPTQTWTYTTTYNSTTKYCQHAPNGAGVDVPITQTTGTATYTAKVKVLLGDTGKWLTQACTIVQNMVSPTGGPTGYGGDPEVSLWINFDVRNSLVPDPKTGVPIGPHRNIYNCVLARSAA